MSGDVSELRGPAPSSSAIGLYARATEGFEQRLTQACEVLANAYATHGTGLLQSSSLGAEDMVITALLAEAGLPVSVATLDTGHLHDQTLALLPQIEARYGIRVEVFHPVQEQVLRFVRERGENAMYESLALRKECCGIRKLEPLTRMLAGRSAWITGLRREQSSNRAEVPFSEPDGPMNAVTRLSNRGRLTLFSAWKVS